MLGNRLPAGCRILDNCTAINEQDLDRDFPEDVVRNSSTIPGLFSRQHGRIVEIRSTDRQSVEEHVPEPFGIAQHLTVGLEYSIR